MGSAPSRSRTGSTANLPRKDQESTNDNKHKTKRPSVTATPLADEAEAKDVMISYSHADKEMMMMVKDYLEDLGISVWVDKTGLQAGVDFLSKIGQAIIDAKVFISLLSEKTIQSKYCQDELALAYISNKSIIPVALKNESDLFPIMDTGMKLQLARFKWVLLVDEEKKEDGLKELLGRIKKEIRSPDDEKQVKPDAPSGKVLKKQSTKKYINTRSVSMNSSVDFAEDLALTFWDNSFRDKDPVPWNEFTQVFCAKFHNDLEMMYGNESRIEWLLAVLKREMAYNDDTLYKENFIDFCTIDNEHRPLWECVQNQAIESYTMMEVFDMDSSVRVQAIENLGKFNSPTVRNALLDLMSGKDNNVRAVAAISLAKTGAQDKEVVKKLLDCLNDKDRLVRESGCLALGHLQLKEAVPKLVQLWRNDFISHVREAATIALEKIGGEEANKAMHMTKVLSDEIHMLTQK